MGKEFVNHARLRRLARREKDNKPSANLSAPVVLQVVSEPAVPEAKSPEMLTKSQELSASTANPFLVGLEEIIRAANKELDNISTASFKVGGVVVERRVRF